jgi:hypothetical protein
MYTGLGIALSKFFNMKRDKILYWVFTGVLALFFLFSSYLYLSRDSKLVEGFKYLGYPSYFIPLLGLAKLIGALVLVNPWSVRLREWAYAGFTFTLTGAIWTHAATHSPVTMPLVFLVLLAVSYFFHLRLQSSDLPQKQLAL